MILNHNHNQKVFLLFLVLCSINYMGRLSVQLNCWNQLFITKENAFYLYIYKFVDIFVHVYLFYV
jgi:RecB family endonuclease NucS